jgi:hypothetical protein
MWRIDESVLSAHHNSASIGWTPKFWKNLFLVRARQCSAALATYEDEDNNDQLLYVGVLVSVISHRSRSGPTFSRKV